MTMSLKLSWLCFCIILCCLVHGREEPGPNIAVIGAGVGGSSFSYYIRELLPHGTNITVYEAAKEVGGRVNSFSFADSNSVDDNRHHPKSYEIEQGASIIYTGNMLAQEAVRKFQLKTFNAPSQSVGFWNGQTLVATKDGFFKLLKTIWRWGPIRMFHTWRKVYKTLEMFMSVYDNFEKGETYTTGDELWGALGLLELTKMNISQALGGDSSLVDEFVAGINGANYNQGNHINGLAGMISLCPAVTGDTFGVVGGNKQIASSLLKSSRANVKYGVKVTSVVKLNDEEKLSRSGAPNSPRYALYAGDKRIDDQEYDAVVLAAPLSQAGISFYLNGTGRTVPQIAKQMFQTTHTTLVVGNVKSEAFGLRADEPVPSAILLTKDGREKEMWSKMSIEKVLENGRTLYKLFSSNELPSGALDVIFGKGEYSVVKHKKWEAAYPKLYPLATWSSCGSTTMSPPCYPILPFSGHDSIFYLNAIEMAVSAIEISMISAKNAALLLEKNWNHTMDVERRTVVAVNNDEQFPKTDDAANRLDDDEL
eukprot:489501_1